MTELYKVNGKFSTTDKAKEYVVNPEWKSYQDIWDLVSGSTEGVGKIFYEHISNFVQNIRDIDTCGLHQLYSIANELNVQQIFSYDLQYPVELEELMNTLSTNRSFTVTTGYVLHNDTLAEIYSDIGLSVTGGVSGELTSNIIYDSDYITGFLEPAIRTHLVEKSTYLGDGGYLTTALAANAYDESLKYQGFMDDIYSDPQSEWSSATSADIIEECTHFLRNVCVRASYQRETLKTIAQKHAMIGSTRAIEKLISEYIMRSYTKRSDWRVYVAPSGGVSNSVDMANAYYLEQILPTISDVNSYFNVDVVEYWDKTEYMNISAESPYACGIIGYSSSFEISSWIDTDGNILTAQIPITVPQYAANGLCGYVVTGGNLRFWEGETLQDNILDSVNTSGEISAFYHNIGLTGNFDEMYSTQVYLWNMFATSGFNREAVNPFLTGTPTDLYVGTDPELIPESGWLIAPTNLSGMHWKYMGTVSGNMPPANIKNSLYPTIAPQPFLWNLIEKVYEDFPDILRTLLASELTDSNELSNQIDASGNLIDSWKFRNHEFTGYQTFYEESANLNYNSQVNSDIDRDGSFHGEALITYVSGGDMQQHYDHISKEFNLSGIPSNIQEQLTAYESDIIGLSAYVIYQYAYDHYDNHFMLYKTDRDLNEMGRMWMRYRNHPMPFPLTSSDSADWMHQQMYVRGDSLYELGTILNGRTYDFGFYDNVFWTLGNHTGTIAGLSGDCLIVGPTDYMYFDPPKDETLYTLVSRNNIFPQRVNIGSINNFVGHYMKNDYIIFVYLVEWVDSTTIHLKFKHYNRYTYKLENSPLEDVYIYDLPAEQFYPTEYQNVWRLSASENIVSICYEAVNNNAYSPLDNALVTIDIVKSTLDGGNVTIALWDNILEMT